MMRDRNRLLLSAIILSSLLLSMIASGGNAAAQPNRLSTTAAAALPPPVIVAAPQVSAFEGGLELFWQAGELSVQDLGAGKIAVEIAGFEQHTVPGEPRLPVGVALVALPGAARPSFEFISVDEYLQPGKGRVAYTPRGSVAAGETPVSDYNPSVLSLEEIGVMRGVRLARLLYYPVVPTADGLLVRDSVRAFLRYNLLPGGSAITFVPPDEMIENIRAAVLNPDQVQTGVSPAIAETAEAATAVAIVEINVDSDTSDDLPVDLPKVVEISYSALQGIGFPVTTADPANLQLWQSGVQITMDFQGDGDQTFEPGESFQFISFPRPSRWTNKDTYLLKVGASAGLRMSTRSATPGVTAGVAQAERLFEKNMIYMTDCYHSLPDCADYAFALPLGRDGDRFLWKEMKLGGVAVTGVSDTWSYSFSLNSVNTSQAASLTVWVVSYTDKLPNPDHRLRASLNGVTLTPNPVDWDGVQALQISFSIPAGVLATSNTLTISLPGISNGGSGSVMEGMWVDAFSLRYALGSAATGGKALFQGEATQKQYAVNLGALTGLKGYDITQSNSPVKLTGYTSSGTTVTLADSASGAPRRYFLATGSVATPTLRLQTDLSAGPDFSGADTVMIAPAEFINGLSPLVTQRQQQGRQVVVENLQAIYDHFNEGRMAPEAIQAYLSNAYHNWSLIPLYVTLVGDGTHDPKKYFSGSFNTYLPPYLMSVDPYAGETATDNRFVTVDGPDDRVPDMMIGRLPVNSTAELQTVVNKMVNYETALPAGNWRKTALFVTDDPDDAGDFYADADHLADNFFPTDFTKTRIYLPTTSPDGAATKAAVISAWNTGAKFVTYVGHSSYHFWAAEELLHATANVPPPSTEPPAKLKNGNLQPIVLEMTCYTGTFQDRGLEVLDERLLRAPAAGAVAVLAPTGLGLSEGHKALAEGFLDYAFNHKDASMGKSVLEGKLKVLSTGMNLDLLDTFLLLGDSAMIISPGANLSIQKQASASTVSAGAPFSYTITVQNNGPADAQDVIVSDAIPAALDFVSSNPSPTSQNPHTWNLGTILSGQTRTITIQVKAKANTSGTVTNTASVSTTASDLIQGNNTASASVNITSDADIQVTKTGPTSGVGLQTQITYDLAVTNLGPSVAANVVLTDTLPVDVSFVSASIAPTVGSNPLVWQLGDMQPNTTKTIQLKVFVEDYAGRQFTNTAIAESDNSDPVSSNNQAQVVTTTRPPTAVLLTSFSVQQVAGQTVTLGWVMATEVNVFKYNLYRASSNDYQAATRVGEVISTQACNYTFEDALPDAGIYTYWLTYVSNGSVESAPLSQLSVGVGLENRIYLPLTRK